jgi:hypothetical protein
LDNIFIFTVIVPELEFFEIEGEVVFSNIFGPDDHISPRGMIVRFLEISGDDRKIIAKEAFEHLKSKEVDSYKLEALQTIILDQEEIGSEAA